MRSQLANLMKKYEERPAHQLPAVGAKSLGRLPLPILEAVGAKLLLNLTSATQQGGKPEQQYLQFVLSLWQEGLTKLSVHKKLAQSPPVTKTHLKR